MGAAVTYVIAEPCIDVLDRACVQEYPVDRIYENAGAFTDDTAQSFTDILPGREQPIAAPGGARKIGRLELEAELFTAHPPLSTSPTTTGSRKS